jgi:hypothetical protein
MKWSASQLARTVPALIASGEAGEVVRDLCGRFWSHRTSYLLRRDCSLSHTVPEAKIGVAVRPVEPADVPVILVERPTRRASLESGLRTCYVGVTDGGQICYMQWLIDASQNALVASQFPGLCRWLNAGEALLEWAYTFRAFRGLGVMGRAMSLISEIGAEAGAQWLYTYVAIDNVPSLRGCRTAGYRPHRLRTERWRLLTLEATHSDLPVDAKYPFELSP